MILANNPVIGRAFDGRPDDFSQLVLGSVDPLQVSVYLDQELIVVRSSNVANNKIPFREKRRRRYNIFVISADNSYN